MGALIRACAPVASSARRQEQRSLEGRRVSFSAKMYGAYLAEKRHQVSHGVPIAESF